MGKYRFETDEHELFRTTIRKFLQKEAEPYYEQWEEDRMIPLNFWKNMGDMGFLCPHVEEKYGGLDLDFSYSLIILEELERIGTSLIGIGLHSDIVTPYIESYGTKKQKEKWLPGCVTGDNITAVAMTEPGTGSDLANIKTTAIRDGDHFIVNGQKTFITNGIQADLILVVVKTDPDAQPKHKGVSLLMVEADSPGFSRGRKLNKVGLHAQDTAELYFEDCRVPKENLIGKDGKGFTYLMEKLQQERLVVAVSGQVASEDMLEMTLEYVKSRKAFGRTVGSFQNSQFKLAEIATQVELGRSFLESLIEDHIAGKDIVSKVSMAKYWLTDTAKQIANECMQLHGGYGYMEEYKIARRFRDTPVAAIYAGSNEIMKSIIAKNIGL
ncbi:acyl-CoA dehydrogenase family protein [Virgibacillus ihumii]|uniref:acyl-CoA dehydrogenase family protein n=1 Tax=Virgibacillus ihumii TaxID=2686091 RepID=UPI00157CC210|nr:acyl-CoA dehydrogenase family protein [Virgibacillus ihumii]